MDEFLGILGALFFLGMFLYVPFLLFTKKGNEKAFGGKIVKTIEQKIDSKEGMLLTSCRVHVLKRKNEVKNAIAIEIKAKTPTTWQLESAVLSKEETRELIQMLEKALRI